MNLFKITASLTDQELISRYKKKRNQKYITELFSRYSHLMMGVCAKYFKNSKASKDGVINLSKSLSKKILTDNDITIFSEWIYAVSKNYCIGELRKKTKLDAEQNKLIECTEFKFHSHPTPQYSLKKQLVALEGCIKKLNKEQEICLSLFYLKKKNYKEVTNLTGFQLNKVKNDIQNGKKNLKNCIEKFIEKDK